MDKIMDTGTVIYQEQLADGVFSLTIETKIAQMARAGQFVNLYCHNEMKILPRPISICQADPENQILRLVYRVVGGGTREFSSYGTGDPVRLLGPLGNGFSLEGKRPILIGGGIGVPPMLYLAEAFQATVPGADAQLVMGYRNRDTFLTEELKKSGHLYIATDDGSLGTHGTVIDAIRENDVTGDVVYACGPKPMLRAVKQYAMDKNLPCYISMEERMACGVGACLGCVIKTVDVDDHSKVKNARVCADGPVFDARKVDLT